MSGKCLMVMAHPDDEIIFGWPIFQDKSIEKELILCSSDANNPERSWCSHRKKVTQRICDNLEIPLTVLDYPSEFYRYETRNESMSKVQDHIVDTIQSKTYDYIFTHNPYGEYGHIDHKMVFDIVTMRTDKPVWITDICMKSNWPSLDYPSDRVHKLYYNNRIRECKLDEDLYSYCEKEYRDFQVWTWNKPPIDKCSIYEI